MSRLFPLFLLTTASVVCAKPFRLAAIYPTGQTAGHQNCTCGQEAACITEAAIRAAKLTGLGIELTAVNDHRDPLQAKASADKVASGKFDAAIGTLESNEALAISRVLEDAKVPFIVPTASHVDITKGRHFVVRTAFNDRRQAQLLAALTIKELNAKRVFIIHNVSNPYSDFLASEFERQLTGKAQVTTVKVIDGSGDFPTIAKKIAGLGSDLVFAPIPQIQLASLYVELLNLDTKLTLLTSDVIEKEPRFLPQVKASTKIKFIYPQHWDGRLTSARGREYLSLHKAHCSRFSPSMTSVAAYEAILTLIDTLRANPKLRGKALVDTIKKTPLAGVTGPIARTSDGEPLKPLELFELDGGKVRYWRRWQ